MKCERCGAVNREIENHHVRPKIKGGSDNKQNIQQLCKPCHYYKNARGSCTRAIEGYQRSLALKDKGGWSSLEAATEYYIQKIKQYRTRIKKLDELNTPEMIFEKGYHESYINYEYSSWDR